MATCSGLQWPEWLARCFGWLWSQEAAGWTQAIFTVVAIWVTARHASRASREESARQAADQAARSRGLALALLPEVVEWHDRMERMSHNLLVDAVSETIFDSYTQVPTKISGEIGNLYLLGGAGESIQRAIFLQTWLVENVFDYEWAMQGNFGDAERERAVEEQFHARLKRLTDELFSARTSIRAIFESELA